MKRREFVRKSIGAGVTAGALAGFGSLGRLIAGPLPQESEWDVVAVRGGEPGIMFDRGIQSMGGMRAFVKRGQTVVIKPNIGWDVIPEKAANTNPNLVGHIVKRCLEAGAGEVYVLDHTCDDWGKCYRSSGIEKAARDAGAKVVPAHSESYFQTVTIPGGKSLKSTKEHETILKADVFINVPALKHHSSTHMSCCMKNLMGNVWDRGYWHRNNLHQCIADFATYRKPHLNVVDAYNVLKRNGPRGVSLQDVVNMKAMVLSANIVAADAAAARFFGSEPSDILYIRHAHEMGLGNMNLEELNINRITV
ncbi:MAG TPA: DUF362 domain-containing protein [Bacteroidetes bacterium]|nr:DUF362 domain-containing protein [Bacteroidota bacterium]